MTRALGWVDQHAAVFIVIGLLSLAYLGLGLVEVQHRQGRDEHSTCVIQARGLPASKHLAQVMVDIQKLLTPFPGEKAAPIPAPVAIPLADLKAQLAAYNALEARQPSGRSC